MRLTLDPEREGMRLVLDPEREGMRLVLEPEEGYEAGSLVLESQ